MADAEVLFAAHRDGVFRYLSRIVGAGEAKELTQEVFLRVARGPLPVEADEAGRRAWIFTIARNLALNHLRDDRRRGSPVALPDRAAAPTQELTLALREALDSLAPLDRDIFLMRGGGRVELSGDLGRLRPDRRCGAFAPASGTTAAAGRSAPRIRSRPDPPREVAMTDQNQLVSPEPDGPSMVVEAFLDGERVAADDLRVALADPSARDHFVDLLVLREAIGVIGGMTPVTWTPAARRGGRLRWLAATAAVAVSLTAGYLAGQRLTGPPPAATSVEALVHAADAPAAPVPTRVIALRPGVNWTDRLEGQ